MKTGTKIGLGLVVAAAASISVAVMISEKVVEKVENETTRHKAKNLVKDKLGGNEKLLSIVDGLSDHELEGIGKVAKEVKNSREQLSHLVKHHKLKGNI